MKLKTKLEKGHYVVELEEVPESLKLQSLVDREEYRNYTVNELKDLVDKNNKKRTVVIKENENKIVENIRKFKDDMVKEVDRHKLDVNSVKVANYVYNQNQGKTFQDIAHALDTELKYLKKVVKQG